MNHIALGIEYDGFGFQGSQSQISGRTVQGELESALSRVADEDIRVQLAGRTDTGVHATHQVLSFRTTSTRSPDAWIRGTNTYLPKDLAVHTHQSVDLDFDPRRSARWRRYVYVFGECDVIPAIGAHEATWVQHSLDEEKIQCASQALVGEHDFSSFRSAQCQSRSPCRLVHKIDVRRAGSYVLVDIIANAFLLRMVRNIAGALQHLSIEKSLDLSALLRSRDRTLAPPTAPADGLYLVQIAYDDHTSLGTLRIPAILQATNSLPRYNCSDFPRATRSGR